MTQAASGLALASGSGTLDGIRIIGHRGSSSDHPENTVQSARAALEKGAAGIEFDVHLSKDNMIFILHDNTLDRTASKTSTDKFPAPSDDIRKVKVTELSYKDVLSKVNVGSFSGGKPEKVPLMEEVMDLVQLYSEPSKPRVAFCELKLGEAETMATEMEKLVKGNGGSLRYRPENLIFISFDIRILYALKKRLPEFKFFFVACGPEKRIGPPDCSTPYSAEEAIAMARYPEQASQAFDIASKQFREKKPFKSEDVDYKQEELHFASRKAAEIALSIVEDGSIKSKDPLDGIDLMAATDYVTKDVVSKAKSFNLKVAVWVWLDKLPIKQVGSNGGDVLEVVSTFEEHGVEYFTSNLPEPISSHLKHASANPGASTPVWVWILFTVLVIAAFSGGLLLGRRGQQPANNDKSSERTSLEMNAAQSIRHPLPPANSIRV